MDGSSIISSVLTGVIAAGGLGFTFWRQTRNALTNDVKEKVEIKNNIAKCETAIKKNEEAIGTVSTKLDRYAEKIDETMVEIREKVNDEFLDHEGRISCLEGKMGGLRH